MSIFFLSMRAISTNIYLTLQSINYFIPYKRIYLLTWSDASVKSSPRHPLPRTRLELWNITHNIILNTRYPHFVNIWLPDWQHYGLFKSTHQMKLSSHHTSLMGSACVSTSEDDEERAPLTQTWVISDDVRCQYEEDSVCFGSKATSDLPPVFLS